MSIATEMKELTRNITTSHEERRKKVSEIREEANKISEEAQGLLSGFGTLRRENNLKLREDLVRDKASRKSEAINILKETQNTLKGLQSSRKGDNNQFRTQLSRVTVERRAEVKKGLGDARKLIGGFAISRQNSKLRNDLSLSVARSRIEVGRLLGNARNLVNGFQVFRRETGDKLRSELGQSRSSMEADVRQMMKDFSQVRGNVRADLKEACVSWRGLAFTIPHKKDKVEITPCVEIAMVEEKTHDFEGEMLAVVNEHPEGLDLAGVAEKFGVAPIVLGRASKSLLDKGKIRKEEKFYFPVASEWRSDAK